MTAVDTVHALLDSAAERWPDSPMLTFFDEPDAPTLTFADTRTQAAALSATLADLGVGHGTPVAVSLPNLPIFPVTWFALARLGAVKVPVNPGFTPEELAFVVADSGVRHAVVHADVVSADGSPIAVLVVPTDEER